MRKLLSKAEEILNKIEWKVIRPLDGFMQGDYRTFFQGFGLDFADIREYQYGDDVRTIDWNVTARMNTPYVRRYHEDRDITAWFLLDLSPSIDFGDSNRRKRDVLIECTAVLARLLTRQGNRVGAILFDGSVPILRPLRAGREQVLTLIKDMEEFSIERKIPETNLSILINAAASVIRRRSLIFLFSDFLSVPGWEGPLGSLILRNEVAAIRLYDPEEEEIPPIGIAWVEDSETGEQYLLDSTDDTFQKEFTRLRKERDTYIQTTVQSWGIDLLSLSTQADLLRELLKFSTLRKKRRSTPRRRYL